MNKEEAFEKWINCTHYPESDKESFYIAWEMQQDTIDKLESLLHEAKEVIELIKELEDFFVEPIGEKAKKFLEKLNEVV